MWMPLRPQTSVWSSPSHHRLRARVVRYVSTGHGSSIVAFSRRWRTCPVGAKPWSCLSLDIASPVARRTAHAVPFESAFRRSRRTTNGALRRSTRRSNAWGLPWGDDQPHVLRVGRGCRHSKRSVVGVHASRGSGARERRHRKAPVVSRVTRFLTNQAGAASSARFVERHTTMRRLRMCRALMSGHCARGRPMEPSWSTWNVTSLWMRPPRSDR